MKQFEKFNAWLISKDKIAEPPMTPQDKYGVDKVASGFRKHRERVVPAFQKCQLCEEVLPAEAFSPCNIYKNGLRPYCRRCMTVYSQVRREKKSNKTNDTPRVRKVYNSTGIIFRPNKDIPPPEKPLKQNDMKKISKRCGRELPIENFAKNLRSSDGYMHICNECWAKAKAEGHAVLKLQQAEPTATLSEPTTDHVETMEAIQQSHDSLAQTVAESKVQNEKIHELTLKALELFDDEALIQALRDRGFEGEIYKKFRL